MLSSYDFLHDFDEDKEIFEDNNPILNDDRVNARNFLYCFQCI